MPFGEEIETGVMPLSKERYFECHNNRVGHAYAQKLREPQRIIGDNSSGGERYCWWRTISSRNVVVDGDAFDQESVDVNDDVSDHDSTDK